MRLREVFGATAPNSIALILGRIPLNSPAFFEQLIVELPVAMGYGGSRLNAAE